MEKTTELLARLKAVKGNMLSRNSLRDYGVTNGMIAAAEKRGEIVTSGPSLFDSVILTDQGSDTFTRMEALARDMCDQDNAEADACLDDASAHPYWERSDEKRRDMFRQKARERLASGQPPIGG
jgi:hypothetical protein